ncbi:MAG TPA: translation initiation factor IF-3 [Actinomycetota bacterium]|nr:translation initiation factor IF-3 [Actinomycetota bacterium]
MNDRIRAPEVRLVGPDGQQVGILALGDALRIARELDLDLVEVAPQARPPVCRLLDYGKYRYEMGLKAKDAKRKSAASELKEMRMRPKIDQHDYKTKKGHIERFLAGGHKVKVQMWFRGREMAHTDLGQKILDRLAVDLAELATVESPARLDGRNMIIVFAPKKRTATKPSEKVGGEH